MADKIVKPISLAKIRMNQDPGDYVADDDLIKAVEIAIALGKPLLVSGEPGTGKTQLAHHVALRLSRQTKDKPFAFLPEPLVFNTKSTSVASDLFYNYDAVSHFRNKNDSPAEQFIELWAMGKAIALSHGCNSTELTGIRKLKGFEELTEHPQSSVVLIDEIDKAPRDFPNDLLNEIEKYEFRIREINKTICRQKDGPAIVLILTSNSEKNLPNAFLRRCVYYHIPFPDRDKLKMIITQRLQIDDPAYNNAIEKAITKFEDFRKQSINKRPATSEFLDWMNILKDEKILESENWEENKNYKASLSAIVKSQEDLKRISS
jgi:MoxR-like ATPase